MKNIVLFTMVLTLTACTFDDIYYTKDSRTGLCFAHQTSITNNGTVDSITNVPCEKVNLYLEE